MLTEIGTYELIDEDDIYEFVEMFEGIKSKSCLSNGKREKTKIVIYIDYVDRKATGYYCFCGTVMTMDESGKKLYKIEEKSYEKFLEYIGMLNDKNNKQMLEGNSN